MACRSSGRAAVSVATVVEASGRDSVAPALAPRPVSLEARPEIYEQLALREVSLTVRLGLPTYAQTGYLAAAAYPLNFTLFRSLGVFRAQIVPDFSARGLAVENTIRCSVRGYRLLKPSYHFLRRPEIRAVLWKRLATGQKWGQL